MHDPGSKQAPAADNSLCARLAHFNAKERWWLLRHVIGASTFVPDRAVVESMARCVGFPPPAHDAPVFAAMDYHLSWLHAALSDQVPKRGVHRREWQENVPWTSPDSTLRHAVENNQEDVDFILAWEAAAPGAVLMTWIVLIEAKGVTRFHEKQNTSKLTRLALILRHARQERSGSNAASSLWPFEVGLLYVSPAEPGCLLKEAQDALAGAIAPEAVKWQHLPIEAADQDGIWYVRLSDRRRDRWSIGWRSGTGCVAGPKST